MIDRHMARQGQEVWCLVEGQPRKLKFFRLLPFGGFLVDNEDGTQEHIVDDATFADSMEELVGYHVGLVCGRIDYWRAEKERLLGLIGQGEPKQEDTK